MTEALSVCDRDGCHAGDCSGHRGDGLEVCVSILSLRDRFRFIVAAHFHILLLGIRMCEIPVSLCVMLNMSCFAPCRLRGCKNRPAPFPGRMMYKATKPGSVCPVS